MKAKSTQTDLLPRDELGLVDMERVFEMTDASQQKLLAALNKRFKAKAWERASRSEWDTGWPLVQMFLAKSLADRATSFGRRKGGDKIKKRAESTKQAIQEAAAAIRKISPSVSAHYLPSAVQNRLKKSGRGAPHRTTIKRHLRGESPTK